MNILLSDRVQRIKPSPTLAVSAKAALLKAQGKDVLALGVGEPDFETPVHIQQAAIQAIHDGYSKYTPVDGLPSLKKAVIEKFSRDNGLEYNPNQILVSVGGKHSCFNLILALINHGDEVVIPAPYWVSYPDIVKVAGGTPKIINTSIDQGFKMTPDQLDQAITAKTKLVFINSPSNPTGIAYSKKELTAFAEVLLKHPHVIIATDDMYEHILWSKESFHNILMVCPKLYERTIVLNGVSKAYAMTGWRIGYAGGPDTLIAAMKKLQSQSTSNPTAVAQKAAEAALSGDQSAIKVMVKAFKQRHDFVYSRLSAMTGIKVLPADGAFYSFPNIQNVINNMDDVQNDVEFSSYLLDKAGLAVIPGSAFGSEGCIRLSYATSMETLDDAMQRLEKAITL